MGTPPNGNETSAPPSRLDRPLGVDVGERVERARVDSGQRRLDLLDRRPLARSKRIDQGTGVTKPRAVDHAAVSHEAASEDSRESPGRAARCPGTPDSRHRVERAERSQIATGGSLIRMRILPLEGSPLFVRSAVLGAAVAGLAGGVVGLVLGLFAYPPTAWFAVIELGLPAALLGGLCGLAIGAIASIGKRPSSNAATLRRDRDTLTPTG